MRPDTVLWGHADHESSLGGFCPSSQCKQLSCQCSDLTQQNLGLQCVKDNSESVQLSRQLLVIAIYLPGLQQSQKNPFASALCVLVAAWPMRAGGRLALLGWTP